MHAGKMLQAPERVVLQVFGVQALGGTGALRIGMDLMNQQCGVNVAYVTDPTWGEQLDCILLYCVSY